jgi:hypothetical protein
MKSLFPWQISETYYKDDLLFYMQRSALTKFQEDPTCMALVMDGTAALGLDLSFVTHVFLMEPIWDRR